MQFRSACSPRSPQLEEMMPPAWPRSRWRAPSRAHQWGKHGRTGCSRCKCRRSSLREIASPTRRCDVPQPHQHPAELCWPRHLPKLLWTWTRNFRLRRKCLAPAPLGQGPPAARRHPPRSARSAPRRKRPSSEIETWRVEVGGLKKVGRDKRP